MGQTGIAHTILVGPLEKLLIGRLNR